MAAQHSDRFFPGVSHMLAVGKSEYVAPAGETLWQPGHASGDACLLGRDQNLY